LLRIDKLESRKEICI